MNLTEERPEFKLKRVQRRASTASNVNAQRVSMVRADASMRRQTIVARASVAGRHGRRSPCADSVDELFELRQVACIPHRRDFVCRIFR